MGKETAQNILAFRFANGIFEPLWNRNYIDYVEITAVENLGIEGRGGFYEGAGALRDMVQNHLIQLVALTALEPPAVFNADNFRNEVVKEALMKLLNERDGLILGVCNGFQALIKLGLVPYGDIRPITAYDPTLTFNTIGRHQSMLVRTRIASTGSPWLSKCEVGEQFTVAISHGEGRFVAPQEVLDTLMKNGQIATQYVDIEGNPHHGPAL